MSLSVVIGHAQAIYGREAAAQATHRALEQLGRNPAIFGIIIASHHHVLQQVWTGASALLGDIPLFGFSTTSEITPTGLSQHSTIVALISGEGINIKADWWPGFGEDSRSVTQQMAQAFQLYHAKGNLLVTADGFSGDARQLCAGLPTGEYSVAGCLSGGSISASRTFQIGGRQSGAGGLAAAHLTGNIAIGVGMGHGWQPTGVVLNITKTSGNLINTLNDLPAVEAYANLFQYPVREWLYPPLNELARLYPLGLEGKEQESPLIRSPLCIDSDGALRMCTVVNEGSIAYMMVGSASQCLDAARMAARQALASLGKSRPVLACIFADISWQMLFDALPGREIQAVREVLGADIPIIGGYTYGQIALTDNIPNTAELFNQHLQVVVFGDL